MEAVFLYSVITIIIVISVIITLIFKSELEQMFTEGKSMMAFHICNVLIILMVAMAAYSVITLYVLQQKLLFIRHLFIILLIIAPIYLMANAVFEKHKFKRKKYIISENKKVIILNEEYLRRKSRRSKLKKYNSFFEKFEKKD